MDLKWIPYKKTILFIALIFVTTLNAPITISSDIPNGPSRARSIREAYLEWDITAVFFTKAIVFALFVTCFIDVSPFNCLFLTVWILEMIWRVMRNSVSLLIFVADDRNWPMAHNSTVICGLCLLLNIFNLAIMVQAVKVSWNLYKKYQFIQFKESLPKIQGEKLTTTKKTKNILL